MPGNRTTAADLVKGDLDSHATSMASDIGHAIKSGQIQFKKSKYDMPDAIPGDAERAARHQEALKKGNKSGKAIFGAPAPHAPNMDYNSGRPSTPATGFAAIAMEWVKQQGSGQQKTMPDRYELDQKPTTLQKAKPNDNVGGLIDDLMKSLKKG